MTQIPQIRSERSIVIRIEPIYTIDILENEILDAQAERIIKHGVAGFLGYPQPGGGAHPPIPSEGGLGEVLWRLG